MILIGPSTGVAAVSMPVGHAAWEHLQPSGRRSHEVAGSAGADP